MKPHPFLNAATPGYPRACLNIAGLVLLFAGTGAGFIAAGATCPATCPPPSEAYLPVRIRSTSSRTVGMKPLE